MLLPRRRDARLGDEVTGALIAIERWQFFNSIGLLTGLAWFTREYTGIRVPRWLVVAFYGTVAAFTICNLVAPYSAFFASPPEMGTMTVDGRLVTIFSIPRGPLQYAWLTFAALFMVFAIGMGVRLLLRGERRRGAVFVSAFGMMFLAPLAAVVEGMMRGRQQPSSSALGALSLLLIMSMDLALEFRARQKALKAAFAELEAHAERISGMLETSLQLRDQLNTPLQTMELELVLIDRAAPEVAPRVARLRRALERLTDLGQRLQRTDAPDQPTEGVARAAAGGEPRMRSAASAKS